MFNGMDSLFRLSMERERIGNPSQDAYKLEESHRVQIPLTPAHELIPEFCPCLYETDEPIHILCPKLKPAFQFSIPSFVSQETRERLEVRQAMLAKLNPPWEDYFTDHGSRLQPDDQINKIPAFHASLGNEAGFSPGFVKLEEDTLIVGPGIRRLRDITEEQIARGIYLHQFQSKERHLHTPYVNFYADCVAPNMKLSCATTPIEWAAERLKIVYGYQTAFFDKRDQFIGYTEHPYRMMASWATNKVPVSLAEPRSYEFTEDRHTLLRDARKAVGRALTSEAVIFLLDNEEALRSCGEFPKSVSNFLRKLPQALENGLVIDRVSELIKAQTSTGVPAVQAVTHAIKITTSIYLSAPEKPWWFKENFPLVRGAAHAFDPKRSAEMELIAEKAGFAFEYACEVYDSLRSNLLERAGLSQGQAIHCVVEVTKQFGIGNPTRAINVGEFAARAIEETVAGRKTEMMHQTLAQLGQVKPLSEVLGLLAGEAATFSKPGLYSLLNRLGSPRADLEEVNDNSLRVEDLDTIAAGLSLPMSQRLLVRPVLAEGLRTDNLLSSGSKAVKLLTAPRVKDNAVAVVTNPVSGWFNFDKQLRSECSVEHLEVAALYFTFYATKFPDPFKPPTGFLQFLSKFKEIPDPNHRFTFLEAPSAREALGKQNAQHRVDRFSIVSNLLDSHIAGVLSWGEVSKIFDWVTASELPAEISKRIEVDNDWEQYWGSLENVSSHAEMLHDAYLEYRNAKIREKEELAFGGRYIEPEQDPDRFDDYDVMEEMGLGSPEAREDLLRQEEESFQDALARQGRDFDAEVDHDRSHMDKHEIYSGVQGQRFEKLQSGFRVILSLNALVSSDAISHKDLAIAYSRFVSELIANGKPEITVEECSAVKPHDHGQDRRPAAPYRVVNFTEFKEAGYIRGEVVRDALSSCRSLDDFSALAARLEAIHEAIVNARKLVNDHNARWGQNISAESRTAVSKMWLEIGRLMVDEPIVDRDKAVEMLAKQLPDDRATRMMIRLHKLQADGLGIRRKDGELTVHRDVSDKHMSVVNAQILSVWGYMAVGHVHDTIEKPHDRRDLQEKVSGKSTTLSLRDPLAPLKARVRRGKENAAIEAAYAAIPQEVPKVIDRILAHREASFGLLPVGGKIHVMHPINEQKFQFIRDALGIDHTSFKVLHAGTSLLLPPMTSAGEMELIVKMLDYERVVDSDYPEIQITSPGRLGAYDCGILGAAVLLGTSTGVEYQPNAFYTTHSDTGCRMVAYDDEGPRSEFPFSTKIPGRTDVLGRRGIRDAERSNPLDSDFYKIQLLHTVLVRAEESGPMGELAAPFKERFAEILVRHGLEGVLQENWVAKPKDKVDLSSGKYTGLTHKNAGKRHFEHAVKPCTDAWFRCQEHYEATGEVGGVVSEVTNLFVWLESEVKKVQAQMLQDPTYRTQREALLSREAFSTNSK